MAEPDVTNGDEVDDTYDPSTVEANRNIQQGGGVGARDLARQDEPAEIVTPEVTTATTTRRSNGCRSSEGIANGRTGRQEA
jgi:hypothetical protein